MTKAAIVFDNGVPEGSEILEAAKI